ncbi:MAG: DUF5688 family protein [Lachnospiraceae bacterium]
MIQMGLNEFKEKVRKALKDYYGEDAKVKLVDVKKNNGIQLVGITVMEKEHNISPTIYLEQFLHWYEQGETFSSIIREIIGIFEKYKVDKPFQVSYLEKYENVRGNIAMKLISLERNEELLKDIPYIEYLDMAIVFYHIVPDALFGIDVDKDTNASMLITHNLLKLWNKTKETLYEDAIANGPRLLPYKLLSMAEMMKQLVMDRIMKEMIEEEGYDRDNEDEMEIILDRAEMEYEYMFPKMEEVPMHILTNQNQYFGAATILYHNILQDVADSMKEDLIILPSSIHEVILLPYSVANDASEMANMVKEINRSVLSEEEILTDSVYRYSREKHCLYKVA